MVAADNILTLFFHILKGLTIIYNVTRLIWGSRDLFFNRPEAKNHGLRRVYGFPPPGKFVF
jgi:hypothetical protein